MLDRSASLLCATAWLACACSVHDADLLDPPESKMHSGLSGGSGSAPPITSPPSSPPIAPSTSACGDGRISAGEKCDTAIPAGMGGACPTGCVTPTPCSPRMLSGTDCQVECITVPATCISGDDCCPQGCTDGVDSDCSSACGDGEVDADEGETCEPGTEAPCPAQADCFDEDPCTEDLFVGSEENCNAACEYPAVTTATDGDGCCLETENANTDDDCEPACGNGVVEPGEDCDGGDGCTDCVLTYTAAQQDCITRFTVPGSATEDCQRCSCIECTQLVMDCRDDSDSARRMACDTLINCGLTNDCSGNPCYCGSDQLCLSPNGPCVAETTAASGLSEPVNPLTLLQRNMDPTYAVGRANLLGACANTSCSAFCP